MLKAIDENFFLIKLKGFIFSGGVMRGRGIGQTISLLTNS